MFVNAIERAALFTRPIHMISRDTNNVITPGAATLFLINKEGYALTCKHVVEFLMMSEKINANYAEYKAERNLLPKDGKLKKNIEHLKAKYKIFNNSPIQSKASFLDCVDHLSGFTFHMHPIYDLAIIKFNGFENIPCEEFAVFKKDTTEIKQGEFLCRLGFPFPEFNNFQYNEENDDIEWTQTGNCRSPRFPIEGMVTRFLGNGNGGIYGIEMSTPGLRGQSGGPLFDKDGFVCGMQSQTKHLHLGFDMENFEIISNGKKKKVTDYSFIHLGECIHAGIIKDFLKQDGVNFSEQ